MKLHVEVLHFQCVHLGEVSPFLHFLTHQDTKEPVSFASNIQLDLQQCSLRRIHRCIGSRPVLTEKSEVLFVNEIIIIVQRLSAPNRPQDKGQYTNILTKQRDGQLGGFLEKTKNNKLS